MTFALTLVNHLLCKLLKFSKFEYVLHINPNNKEYSNMLGFLFKDKKLKNVAYLLFSKVIEQSRLPVFYTDYLVEDSIDGRFDLMALHMSILINKLDQSAQSADLKRMLQEAMFDNLDLTMREIGVGDLGVGKKVKIMAEAFYGRMNIYQENLNRSDQDNMQKAILRNLYRQRNIPPAVLEKLADYYFTQGQYINNQTVSDIMLGNIAFVTPKRTFSND